MKKAKKPLYVCFSIHEAYTFILVPQAENFFI